MSFLWPTKEQYCSEDLSLSPSMEKSLIGRMRSLGDPPTTRVRKIALQQGQHGFVLQYLNLLDHLYIGKVSSPCILSHCWIKQQQQQSGFTLLISVSLHVKGSIIRILQISGSSPLDLNSDPYIQLLNRNLHFKSFMPNNDLYDLQVKPVSLTFYNSVNGHNILLAADATNLSSIILIYFLSILPLPWLTANLYQSYLPNIFKIFISLSNHSYTCLDYSIVS